MSTDSPELPSLAGGSTTSQLGSLAQSAREKSLRNARTYLIVIGLITAVVNAFMVYRMPEEVHQEVAKLQAKGHLIDRQAVEAAVRAGQVMAGAFVLLGIVFVALGITVKSYPVPITITAFVLYVGAAGGHGVARSGDPRARFDHQNHRRYRAVEIDPGGRGLSARIERLGGSDTELDRHG